jgi:hypothetical protein
LGTKESGPINQKLIIIGKALKYNYKYVKTKISNKWLTENIDVSPPQTNLRKTPVYVTNTEIHTLCCNKKYFCKKNPNPNAQQKKRPVKILGAISEPKSSGIGMINTYSTNISNFLDILGVFTGKISGKVHALNKLCCHYFIYGSQF